MNDRRGHDEDRPLQVHLEVDLDCQPIRGSLRTLRGAEERFVGWLGFLDALRRSHEHDVLRDPKEPR